MPSPGAAPGFASFAVNTDPPGVPYQAPFGEQCGGLGTPPGSSGYRCNLNPGSILILIRPTVIKGFVGLDLPHDVFGTTHPYPSGHVRIIIKTTGPSDSKRYCARLGDPQPIRNTVTLYKAGRAAAPAACSPSGAFLTSDADVL